MKISLGRAVRSLFGSFRLEMSFKRLTVLVVGLERKELIQERYLASKREEQENMIFSLLKNFLFYFGI